MTQRVSSTRRKPKAASGELTTYRGMRDFNKTAEPRGASTQAFSQKGSSRPLAFVIQKHDATRLHYDFRLEWDGVLKSWAVTKGPSYFPGDKRLAVQVEDHPREYGGFEGIIPKGEYGGGTVMLWDRGTWKPRGDVDEGLAKGNLKFTLHGKKLHGDWALIRMGGRAANAAKPNWLLIKEHDRYERSSAESAIIDEAPNSVATGRDLDAIASQEDRVWHSNKAKGGQSSGDSSDEHKGRAKQPGGNADVKSRIVSPAVLKQFPREKLPSFIPPQLATSVATPPEEKGWRHELKLDGYRVQAHISASKSVRRVRLLTRKGLDWTHRMKDIASQLESLPVESALLDGEVVVLAPSGATSFQLLQQAFQEGERQPLYYFAFDLLHLDGHSLREQPLTTRREVLRKILDRGSLTETKDSFIRFSEDLDVNGQQVFANACKLGAEGIISKQAVATYISGRSNSWLKIKCGMRQEFVIGGFTFPSDGSHGIGALLLGYYQGRTLMYAGRTGTGFTQATRRALRGRFEKLHRQQPAFDSVPSDAKRGAHWVKPDLVAEVSFATWTADNLVRQASFKGLREDKSASDVVREGAKAVEDPKDHGRKSKPKHSRLVQKAAQDETAAEDVHLTHPDKELDPESHLTKQELANYYRAIAKYILPYIASRPLSLVRCPDGSSRPCFFQKHLTGSMPEGIEGKEIAERGGGKKEAYITLSTPEALMGLAQLGVMEIHPWGSHNDSVEKPDQLIFDLDPGDGVSWPTLADAARNVRAHLKKHGLASFLKSTGGKGVHVVAPILPEHEWPEVKAFARQLAQEIEAENPELYLTKMTRSARKGRIFVDYLRNDRGATAVAPYSPRARSGAPVAVPLAWKELASTHAPVFRVHDFDQWSGRLRRDPWRNMLTMRQSLRLPDQVQGHRR
jgi:bifunctional non-homologous end joining protein LigD